MALGNNEDGQSKFKLGMLEKIYERQHFFIDRHETIAEKLFTSLAILGGFVSIVLGFHPLRSSNRAIAFSFLFMVILFFGVFLLSFCLILNTIRPLSSKALRKVDNELIPSTTKPWIKESLIYYRGITKLVKECLSGKKDPIMEYNRAITENNITNDYIKQIFILSYYSDFKRDQLERATILTVSSAVLGVILLVVLFLFQ
ncbi:hypothetical protein MUP01_10425 [Candidatus Bathyarchaeota archaeon]|nr:hypothetical protein [Candidatus Bathyarchaeota archaeon]